MTRIETLAVHAGGEPDESTGAVSPPIHMATTFRHGPAGERQAGFEYQREGNPTQDRLETALAAMEGGQAALCFGSGMAAMSAALDGYRVLVIDLDSQGSMTSILGGQVQDEWQTVFPLIAKDYARALQAENRVRAAGGHPTMPLDETLKAALDTNPKDLIQKTHWPNIDLIGAQLNLYWAEFQIPVWRMQSRGWKLWDALTETLAADGILDQYDVIFLDTPPALGYLTINGLAAADILLVPMGASFLEFDSTGRFFDMLHSTFRSIEEGENMAARALGLDGNNAAARAGQGRLGGGGGLFRS